MDNLNLDQYSSRVIVLDSAVMVHLMREIKQLQESVAIIAKEVREGKDNRWVTAKEAAQYIGFTTKTLEKYQEEIGYSQVGGKDKRFRISDVDTWMTRHFIQRKHGR